MKFQKVLFSSYYLSSKIKNNCSAFITEKNISQLPNTGVNWQSVFVGEDMHFSYMLQKYLNLKTFVPPHPKDNKKLWGSDPEMAMKVGTDKNSISYNQLRKIEMNEVYLNYLKKGFCINPNLSLKTKGKAKEIKSKISQIIKKI